MMQTTTLTVWHSLIENAPEEQREALLFSLSNSLREELSTLPVIAKEKLLSPPSLADSLAQIHFSWLAPFLRTLTEREIKLFLSALSKAQAQKLKSILLLSSDLSAPSELGIQFLRETLFQEISPEDLLPWDCLPPHSLNHLLLLSSDQLFSLVNLLAMHDLSIEIRHIIDTSKLKKIYALLSRSQAAFLKTLVHKKEPIAFKRIGLPRWEKDPETLHALLTQRGLNRLAKALFICHPSLLWHVAHKLDMAKGQVLFKLSTALSHSKAYDILCEQALELADALNPLS